MLADGVPKEDLLKAIRDSLETFEGHMKDAAYELCALQELAKRKGGKFAAVVGNIAGAWFVKVSPIIGTRSKSVPTVDGVYAWLRVNAEKVCPVCDGEGEVEPAGPSTRSTCPECGGNRDVADPITPADVLDEIPDEDVSDAYERAAAKAKDQDREV